MTNAKERIEDKEEMERAEGITEKRSGLCKIYVTNDNINNTLNFSLSHE